MTELMFTLKELIVFCCVAGSFGCLVGASVMAGLALASKADRLIDEAKN